MAITPSQTPSFTSTSHPSVAIEPDRFRDLVDAYGRSIADCALARHPANFETLEAEVPRAYEALMKHHKAALQKAEHTGRETGRESIAEELAESKAESAKMQKSYKSSLREFENWFEACDKVRMACMSHLATILGETNSLKRKTEDEEKGREEAEARTKRALEATKLIDPATKGHSSM